MNATKTTLAFLKHGSLPDECHRSVFSGIKQNGLNQMVVRSSEQRQEILQPIYFNSKTFGDTLKNGHSLSTHSFIHFHTVATTKEWTFAFSIHKLLYFIAVCSEIWIVHSRLGIGMTVGLTFLVKRTLISKCLFNSCSDSTTTHGRRSLHIEYILQWDKKTALTVRVVGGARRIQFQRGIFKKFP